MEIEAIQNMPYFEPACFKTEVMVVDDIWAVLHFSNLQSIRQ
jgi:hypothetical protein